MPRIDPATIEPKRGSDYPAPFHLPLAGREARNVMPAGADFVANHVIVPPGGWSSQRHWHVGEDEIVVVLSGAAILVDEEGRHPMAAGEIAVFPKGDGNGHKLVNEGDAPLVLLAVSLPEASKVVYSDIDLIWTPEGGEQQRNGTPYPRRDQA
ncbi:putative cupin superfamily protein [Sphingomonas insulae]|uniref:Cupin domain-containing protein n=2 Tax=Sphingomonas insulae TaxID=424800 RepID=A0ABP3T176_9SPHN|nr:cupin domain-containing protein [Sphingomonas insulae]NIJ29263.1 putative cupin superfamily protein [Sphingomonas insulae]